MPRTKKKRPTDGCTRTKQLKGTGGSYPSGSTGYNNEAGGRGEKGGIFG